MDQIEFIARQMERINDKLDSIAENAVVAFSIGLINSIAMLTISPLNGKKESLCFFV